MDIAVIGGGASAALLLGALRRRHRGPQPLSAAVIERSPRAGPGVAYATTDPWHRMNVRAKDLGVDPDDPLGFVRWATRVVGHPIDPDAFVQRGLYGRYLAQELERSCGNEVQVIGATVTDLVPPARPGGRWTIVRDRGEPIAARAVVLGLGVPPVAPRRIAVDPAARSAKRFVDDPWSTGALDALRNARRILVVGSGLTAVDVTLSLIDRARAAQITLVSPSGCLPATHRVGQATALRPVAPPPGRLTARQVLAWAREVLRDEPNGYQAGLDAIRPHAQDIWTRLPMDEQARLLRLVESRWMRHRHRMPPQIGRVIEHHLTDGRIELARGRVVAVGASGRGRFTVGVTGPAGPVTHLADGVVICTGPERSVSTTQDPLLRRLLDRGVVGIGPHGRGLAIDAEGAVRDAHGSDHRSLFVVGAHRRGSEIEATAIPDLRTQAATVAARLDSSLDRPGRAADDSWPSRLVAVR